MEEHLERTCIKPLRYFRQVEHLKTHLITRSLVHIGNCVNLTQLELEGRNGISDLGIAHLSKIKDLRELNLNQTSVTDVAIQLLISFGWELRRLELARTRITDRGIRLISTTPHVAESIQSLNVSECHLLTLECMQLIRANCFQLYRLDARATELVPVLHTPSNFEHLLPVLSKRQKTTTVM